MASQLYSILYLFLLYSTSILNLFLFHSISYCILFVFHTYYILFAFNSLTHPSLKMAFPTPQYRKKTFILLSHNLRVLAYYERLLYYIEQLTTSTYVFYSESHLLVQNIGVTSLPGSTKMLISDKSPFRTLYTPHYVTTRYPQSILLITYYKYRKLVCFFV